MKTKIEKTGKSLIELVSLLSAEEILDPLQMIKTRGGDGDGLIPVVTNPPKP